jgi:hypothetical protein
LRSLLVATMWLALILAICVKYQHAATRHRESLDSLGGFGLVPQAATRPQSQAAPQGIAPRPRPADRD